MTVARYTPLLFLSLLLAMASCERPVPPAPAAGEQAAFNLTAYLQQQQKQLQAAQPMVLKSVKTEDKPDETIETDKVDWADELAVFEELDLNRPTLLEYYTRQDSTLSNGSKLISYTRLPDAKALVQFMQLRLSPDQKLQELKGVIQDKNILFYTSRNLELQTNPATGNVASYRIEGVQKLIFSDSLHYQVIANL